MNKYRNKKTVIDGIKFDSINEAGRYAELKLLERAGKVKELVLQPKFELQEGFVDKRGTKHRAIAYVGDFQYYDSEKDIIVVEDVKGMQTEVFKIKKKLLLYKYPDINFREVR